MPNPTRLLKIALTSLFEPERSSAGKLWAVYYNIVISCNRYSEDGLVTVLLDEAERSCNRLIDATCNAASSKDGNSKGSFNTFEFRSGKLYNFKPEYAYHSTK